MATKDPRIDAYIGNARDFAKPILIHLRALVHRACPDVEETIKWSFPCFDYKGPFCSMAAFKEHCTFGFWKTSLIKDPKGLLGSGAEAMGSFGRLRSLADLPKDSVMLDFIRQAMKLNDEGVKVKRAKPAEKKPLRVPSDLKRALVKNKKALVTFEQFNPSNKREYVEWILEAKLADTRAKRLATAVEWMADGKARNWKYERK